MNINPNTQTQDKGYFQLLKQYEDIDSDEEWDTSNFDELNSNTQKEDDMIDAKYCC